MRASPTQLRSNRGEPRAWSFARMSENGHRSAAADPDARGLGPVWPWLIGCLAIAALTLLLPSTPTYDPWAWILWGREIAHFDLVTNGGPSWKPLPIVFTTVFSLVGHDVAPFLWVVVGRAGGLLACVMSYRVAYRLMRGSWLGVVAGIASALALFASFHFVRDAALGNSEPLLAALFLWAFERHLDGRRDHALYLGVACALLRPEVWPFLGLYGLWLWVVEPRLRMRMVGFAVLIPALWFLPEWWGAGDPFRAGARANAPNPGSVAFAEHPALELFDKFRAVTISPVELGVVIAVGYAIVAWVRRRAEGRTLAFALIGFAWFALVAAMTEGGFAGNQRYLIVTTAVVCVLGGIGVTRVVQGVGWIGERVGGTARTGTVTAAVFLLVALVAATPIIRAKANNISRVAGGLEHEADVWHDLKGAIDQSGGPDRLLACGGVFSGPFQTQMVAYELGIHGIAVGWKETPPPGVAFRTRTVPDGPLVTKPTDDRFRLLIVNGKERVLTVPPEGGDGRCPAADPSAPTAPAPRAPQGS
jgi:hypothetical protein